MRKKMLTRQRKSKLQPKWDGPFQVSEMINDNAYKIDHPGDEALDLTSSLFQEGGNDADILQGRGLMDSVLVANEVLEEVKRKKKSCVVFKVDYEKAYNSVKWEFMYYMLARLGFCDKLILWIKAFLESATVSVLINGSPTKESSPLKGLRQGDPLTPFLFLIVPPWRSDAMTWHPGTV
ncbi:secreted RxLR effector protein 78-like [Phaseolus vulgaris]|uniref:secreted RxLR effector protein 78-like n=1 Tax=Phaseolus vulgaris TaxID=3885 RepID=UPI0035CBCBCB